MYQIVILEDVWTTSISLNFVSDTIFRKDFMLQVKIWRKKTGRYSVHRVRKNQFALQVFLQFFVSDNLFVQFKHFVSNWSFLQFATGYFTIFQHTTSDTILNSYRTKNLCNCCCSTSVVCVVWKKLRPIHQWLLFILCCVCCVKPITSDTPEIMIHPLLSVLCEKNYIRYTSDYHSSSVVCVVSNDKSINHLCCNNWMNQIRPIQQPLSLNISCVCCVWSKYYKSIVLCQLGWIKHVR